MVGNHDGEVQGDRFDDGELKLSSSTIEIELKSTPRWVVAASSGSSSLLHSPLPNLHHCCCASLPILQHRWASSAVGLLPPALWEKSAAGPSPPAVRASSAAGLPPLAGSPSSAMWGKLRCEPLAEI
jgi:hypothetical protein